MNLATQYLGFNLKNPLVGVASMLSGKMDLVRSLEDAGASAVVLYSLFEEQVRADQELLDRFTALEGFPESSHFFPLSPGIKDTNGDEYLQHIEQAKKAVRIPVIGSLSGVSPGGWVRFSKRIQAAGADAIELQISYMPTDVNLTSQDVENLYIEILAAVKEAVTIPVSVKISPFFSSFANMALKLDKSGADGLVLFQRFYSPDIDLERRELVPDLQLSHSSDMRVARHWIGIIRGQLRASLAAAGGIQDVDDVLKAVMAGADVTMLASAVIRHGASHVRRVLEGLEEWMRDHEFDSIDEMKGCMSYRCVAEPSAYEQTHYLKYSKMLREL